MIAIFYLGLDKPTSLSDWVVLITMWILIALFLVVIIVAVIDAIKNKDKPVKSDSDKLEKLLLDDVDKNKGIIDLLMTTNNPEILNLVSRLKDQHKLDEVIYDILDDIDNFDYDYAAVMTILNTSNMVNTTSNFR